jgi:hypothetical protein
VSQRSASYQIRIFFAQRRVFSIDLQVFVELIDATEGPHWMPGGGVLLVLEYSRAGAKCHTEFLLQRQQEVPNPNPSFEELFAEVAQKSGYL